jgi:ribosome-associated toxin RatA of RatAB toxin-antitoxin module
VQAGVKEVVGAASAAVSAPIEDCFALLMAVDRYPSWYPEAVREVEVVQRGADGDPAMVRARLHASIGPVAREFHLLLVVEASRPQTVRLRRVPHDPSDRERFEVTWRLEQAAGTRIRVQLAANLSVPRLLPVGGIGDAMANGFVSAAARAVGGDR